MNGVKLEARPQAAATEPVRVVTPGMKLTTGFRNETRTSRAGALS